MTDKMIPVPETLLKKLMTHTARNTPQSAVSAWRDYDEADALLREAAQPDPAVEELRRDAELLDWLEAQVKSRGNFGVSFDYDHFVEDGYVVESGFRFMRRGYLGERHKTLRAAIEAEKETNND